LPHWLGPACSFRRRDGAVPETYHCCWLTDPTVVGRVFLAPLVTITPHVCIPIPHSFFTQKGTLRLFLPPWGAFAVGWGACWPPRVPGRRGPPVGAVPVGPGPDKPPRTDASPASCAPIRKPACISPIVQRRARTNRAALPGPRGRSQKRTAASDPCPGLRAGPGPLQVRARVPEPGQSDPLRRGGNIAPGPPDGTLVAAPTRKKKPQEEYTTHRRQTKP